MHDQQQLWLVLCDPEEMVKEADHHPQVAMDLQELGPPLRDLGVDIPPGDLQSACQNKMIMHLVRQSSTMPHWILVVSKRCYLEGARESLWCLVIVLMIMAKWTSR